MKKSKSKDLSLKQLYELNESFIKEFEHQIDNIYSLIKAGHKVEGFMLSVSYNIKETSEPRVAFNMSGPINRILNDVTLGVEDATKKIEFMKKNTKGTLQ